LVVDCFLTHELIFPLPAQPGTQAFSETHALDLLRGRTEDISRIVNEKFDKKLVSLKYKPFMLFRWVTSSVLGALVSLVVLLQDVVVLTVQADPVLCL
jgi:hypothetical protein